MELEGLTVAAEAADIAGRSVSGMKSRVRAHGREQLRRCSRMRCEIAARRARGKVTSYTLRGRAAMSASSHGVFQPALVDDRVRALLRANDLPTADLDDVSVFLYGALEGLQLAGVVGLQVLDGVGLLRSLAADPSYRRSRRRSATVRRRHERMRARALGELWLLMTIAPRESHFARLGFEVVSERQARAFQLLVMPTAQFTSLCPSTAVA